MIKSWNASYQFSGISGEDCNCLVVERKSYPVVLVDDWHEDVDLKWMEGSVLVWSGYKPMQGLMPFIAKYGGIGGVVSVKKGQRKEMEQVLEGIWNLLGTKQESRRMKVDDSEVIEWKPIKSGQPILIDRSNGNDVLFVSQKKKIKAECRSQLKRGQKPSPDMFEVQKINDICLTQAWKLSDIALSSQILIAHSQSVLMQHMLCYADKTDQDQEKSFYNYIEQFSKFSGKQLLFGQVEKGLALHGHCDVRAMMILRVPQNIRSIFQVLNCRPSYQVRPEYKAKPTDLTKLNKPVYEMQEFDLDEWEIAEFVGYFGGGHRRISKWKKLRENHGPDGELGYVVPEDFVDQMKETGTYKQSEPFTRHSKMRVIKRQSALMIYEDGYKQLFKDYPDLLKWICETAADVYDTNPNNTSSGLDYENQGKQHQGEPTHLQDIALRRAILSLDKNFKGKRLMHVRGYRTEGYCFNPGRMPTNYPILQPEDKLDFMLPGSVESFWQTNKVYMVKKASKLIKKVLK